MEAKNKPAGQRKSHSLPHNKQAFLPCKKPYTVLCTLIENPCIISKLGESGNSYLVQFIHSFFRRLHPPPSKSNTRLVRKHYSPCHSLLPCGIWLVRKIYLSMIDKVERKGALGCDPERPNGCVLVLMGRRLGTRIGVLEF